MKMSVSFAALRFAPEALSIQRIGAWSTALVLHALAFAALILPLPTPMPRTVAPTPDALIIEFIARVVPRLQPAPPMPTPPTRPRPRPAPFEPRVVPTAIADSTLSVPVREPMPVPDPGMSLATDAIVTPISADAFIAYLDAPPPAYPRLAIRRSLEGTVHLRVRVDAEGRPREVLIERSSGHAVLDREASTHVMRHWRFQPATVDGRPATAWARVPIGFRLDRV